MSVTTTVWVYALPCLLVLLVFGSVMATVGSEQPGTHRAPRGYVPAVAHDHLSIVTTSEVVDITPTEIVHIGATEDTTTEDYAAPATALDGLDTSPDSPEAWLARWTDEYRAERAKIAMIVRLADGGRPPADIPDEQLIRETDCALREVQVCCEDIAARLTSVAESALFNWRIDTPTGELPIIDTPAADRLAAALLEA